MNPWEILAWVAVACLVVIMITVTIGLAAVVEKGRG